MAWNLPISYTYAHDVYQITIRDGVPNLGEKQMVNSMKTNVLKALLFVCVAFGLNGFGAVAQEDNLLTNPGFEEPFITITGNPDMVVAEGWTPWHNPRTQEMESFRNAQPEFAADTTRVRNGANSQVFFTTWLTHDGGVFQNISGLSPNIEYLFSIYAYVWSNDFDDAESREFSANPGGITIQVGIDPLGDNNPNSANIVWSVPVEQYDAYRQYSISVRSASDAITVWVRSQVTFPQANNFIYLDDASLTVSIDQGIVTETTPIPVPTNTEAVVIIPTNTSEPIIIPSDPTPTPEGATNTPAPTNTDIPTNTPAPTNTDIPTNTPVPTNTPLPTNTPFVGDPTPTPEGVISTNTPEPLIPTNTAQVVVSSNTPQPAVATNTPDGAVELATSTPRPAGTRAPIGGAFSADFPNTLLHIVRRGDTVGRLAVLYGSSIDSIAQANGLDDRFLIYVGEELSIPVRIPPPVTTTPTPTLTPSNTPMPTATIEAGIIPVQPPPTSGNTYQVQRGDTLGRIATRFNTTIEAIAQLNGITNPNRIFVGQVLIIPPTGGAISQPNVVVIVVTATPSAPQQPVVIVASGTYTVTYGDSLYRIAVRFNITVADLLVVNPTIANRNLIYVGQVINIP